MRRAASIAGVVVLLALCVWLAVDDIQSGHPYFALVYSAFVGLEIGWLACTHWLRPMWLRSNERVEELQARVEEQDREALERAREMAKRLLDSTMTELARRHPCATVTIPLSLAVRLKLFDGLKQYGFEIGYDGEWRRPTTNERGQA